MMYGLNRVGIILECDYLISGNLVENPNFCGWIVDFYLTSWAKISLKKVLIFLMFYIMAKFSMFVALFRVNVLKCLHFVDI